MKLTRSILTVFLSISLFSVSFPILSVQIVSAQDSRISLQRGYRTGYSDGYMSGYRDAIDNAAKSYNKHNEYIKADRAYNKDYGALEDYRDGYQQGFESGYDTGFEKRSFDATIPPNLTKRGNAAKTAVVTSQTETVAAEKTSEIREIQTPSTSKAEERVADTPAASLTTDTTIATTATDPTAAPDALANTSAQSPVAADDKTEKIVYQPSGESTIFIPTDTELIVELLDNVNTEQNRAGDKFTAKVVSPYELSGAIIEGRVSKIQKPGRIKRRGEVLLSFDRIILNNERWSNFNAVLTEVLPEKGDNVKRVDAEGTIEGRSSVKNDSITVGATTGSGLIIGAIAGGPVGAAVGAGVGAAFGVGAVVIERGRHIQLNKNQQLRIKSAYDTRIR